MDFVSDDWAMNPITFCLIRTVQMFTVQYDYLKDLLCIAYIFVLCPVEDGGKKVMNRLPKISIKLDEVTFYRIMSRLSQIMTESHQTFV